MSGKQPLSLTRQELTKALVGNPNGGLMKGASPARNPALSGGVDQPTAFLAEINLRSTHGVEVADLGLGKFLPRTHPLTAALIKTL